MKLRILVSTLMVAASITVSVWVLMETTREINAQRDRDIAENHVQHDRNIAEINAQRDRDIAEINAEGERKKASLKQAWARDDELRRLAELEKADAVLAASEGEYKHWVALGNAAMLHVEVGSPDKARAYAEELLRLAPNYTKDWNFGNALHKGNLTLGRLALRDDDIETAKQCLLEAGRTPGSPVLNSYGPNMTLAKELLERGERAVVLEYFDLCGKFWKSERGRLQEWADVVNDGAVPEFGPNLGY